MTTEREKVFKLLEVVECPSCFTMNLNWRIVCISCHKDLEAEPTLVCDQPIPEALCQR